MSTVFMYQISYNTRYLYENNSHKADMLGALPAENGYPAINDQIKKLQIICLIFSHIVFPRLNHSTALDHQHK